jgi:hypothetical protein
MSPSRHRRRPGAYRPRRNPREVLFAIACAVGVLVVTAALLFVLRPDDDGDSGPSPSVPIPADTTPASTLPPDSTAPAPAPGETAPPPSS